MHQKLTLEETNLEALRAKKSAVALHYYPDAFISYIVPEKPKRDFIMNRGYWSRSMVFRGMIDKFVREGGRQVVNLGCGLDTIGFWALGLSKELRFFESDLVGVVRQKRDLIEKNKELRGKLEELAGKLSFEKGHVASPRYVLFEADLNAPETLPEKLAAAGVDAKQPTLVLAECVLVYLQPQSLPKLRAFWLNFFTEVAVVDYEMIGDESNFSKIMLKNFANSGIPLLAISQYSSIEKIKNEYLSEGFPRVEALNMREIYYEKLNEEERKRVNKLEWADELEEFDLIQSHYFASVACKGEGKEVRSVVLDALKEFKNH